MKWSALLRQKAVAGRACVGEVVQSLKSAPELRCLSHDLPLGELLPVPFPGVLCKNCINTRTWPLPLILVCFPFIQWA